ncbi:MAG: tetratricopeptide repeat protein [Tepidisphaeraceae bacterium]|jgi:tetratricopeptide (TPR) repeat protein
MTRFHRLELDQQQTQPAMTPVQRQESAYDEKNWTEMADQCRRNGHYETALRYYSRALELDRSLVACWVGQVQMLVQLGEYPEAELWSRKALELFKSNGDLMAGRSQALCRNGDLAQAQAVSDTALGQPGQSAYMWMVRGELMVACRDSIDVCCFDKAIQIDPDWLVLVEIALIYLYYNMPAKALTRARTAVEKASEQAFCWYQQGVCEARLGFSGAARKSLGRCLEISPNHADAERRIKELDAGGSSFRAFFRRLFGKG